APVSIDRVRSLSKAHPRFVHVRTRTADAAAPEIDAALLDDVGGVVAVVEGLRLEPAVEPDPLDRMSFEGAWRSAPYERDGRPAGSWLVVADARGIGQKLAEKLGEAVVVSDGDQFERVQPNRYRIDVSRLEHFERLMREAFGGQPPNGVVHLMSLDS